MKRISIILGIVLLVLAGAGLALRHGRSAPITQDAAARTSGVLGVEEFMQKPGDHPGRIRVQGVVSDVQPDNHLVVLIDRKEWEECGEVGCASLSLPVRWAGPMPHLEEGVAVSGRVEGQAGKFVFVAEELEQVPATPAGVR